MPSTSKEIFETPMPLILSAWAEDQLGLEVTFVDSRALELSGRFVYQFAVSADKRFVSLAAAEILGQKPRILCTVGTDRAGCRIIATMIRQCEEMGLVSPRSGVDLCLIEQTTRTAGAH
jgi:hypothetical protein